MTITRIRRAAALAGAAIVLSSALTGCSALSGILGGNDAQRDDQGNVTEGSSIDIFSLKVGDCKMEDVAGEIQDTDVVPCSEPHDEEVYFEFELADGDFPDEETISAEGETQCTEQFVSYTGSDLETTELWYFWITPTKDTWEQLNDRLVQCVLYHYEGEQLTGSAKGTAL